ncbi:phosphatase domain-containing protein [Carboxylicivirga sp. RSCT41]|uniref:phosphatase domain-containing protein n=1 Tax=Carboxylicivirga agarovorans TaxID=3417570 RepID=UPI003D32FCFE
MKLVWQLTIITFNEQLHFIEGSIASGKPSLAHAPRQGLQHFFQTISSYFQKLYAAQKLHINTGNNTYSCQTDKQGGFSIWIHDLIEDPALITISDLQTDLPVIQSYPIHFPPAKARFDVISDIDDTILVSHTLSHFKRVSTTLGRQAHRRKLVSYTEQLFKFTDTYKPNYIYVSRSEKNLFHLLSNTIIHHDLPAGPLLLTPALHWYQLLKANKPRQHKFNVISSLIEHSGNKSYLLIGDDSQHDMQVYLAIIRKYKSRILMVFIRQTKTFRSAQQVKNWEAIIREGIPGIYYQAFDPFDPNLIKPLL